MKKIFNKIIKDKKLLIGIIIGTIILIIFIIFLSNKGALPIFGKKTNIIESEVNKLELVNYNHNNFSMKIPKGWIVDTAGEGMYFSIRVFDPNDDRYQIFSILKAEPLLKNKKAKNWYENYYKSFGGAGNKILAKAIVLSTPTIESFYSNFNNYVNFVEEIGSTFKAPDLSHFTVIESFQNNSQLKSIAQDDKVIRGTFQDSKSGKKGEGLFMGSLINPGSYNLLGFDSMFYTVYNVIGISAGEYDFVNYKELLTNSLNSLVYKESFVNQTINDIEQSTKNALAINKSINDAFDSYNNAWSSRQVTYDIISQKQSDATLGYERVYDTKTGNIYKAYNGFTDDYTGKRYQAITEKMYTEPIKGYIGK